jgi:Sulfotransferase family
MSARSFSIQSKNRTPASLIANPRDFSYDTGEDIASEWIVKNPHISLYCLDPENQQAIFVETPTAIDIYESSFLYQVQYEYAQRSIVVSYPELYQLAKSLKDSIGKITLLYSVGRCGSTLLSRVFGQMDNILSLSEPDIFSQIVGLRTSDGSKDDELTELLENCIYLLCKPTAKGNPAFCTIKPRSFVIEVADLIYRALPDTQLIFLYRNAEDVVRSFIHTFTGFSAMLPVIQSNILLYTRFISLLEEYVDRIDFTDSNATDLYTVMWLSAMHRYLSLCQQNIPACAIRYEDLVARPESLITDLLNYCQCPIVEISTIRQVLDKDSQEDSIFSRKRVEENYQKNLDYSTVRQKITKILQAHPQIKTPDFIFPNTLGYSNVVS